VAGCMIQSRFLRDALVFAALLGSSAGVQNKVAKNQPAEQTSFGSDVAPGQVLIKKPVEIPEDALQLIKNSRRVLRCLKIEKMTPEQVPASWFVGSEIHLDGPEHADLVVQPALMTGESSPPYNTCLHGAHVAPFWVIRNTEAKHELVLEVSADAVMVLDSRTKGYRDIEEFTTSATTIMSTMFRFDGEKYQPCERQEKPADAGSGNAH
jgi:hypothetical protein